MSKFYVCSCFYAKNYFIPKLNAHVTFRGKDVFLKDYEKFLNQQVSQKSLKQEDIEDIVNQLETECQRRRNLHKLSLERKKIIKEKYKPLHQHVYTLQESYFDPKFLDIVKYCKGPDATMDGLLKEIHVEKAPRVYSFPVFTKEFCDDFLSEVLNFESSDLPKGRPNTMNNYGVLLDELGFDEGLLTPLRENYLIPISRLLYPDWGGGSLDSHKAFIVSYSKDHDLHLDYHYDNAEVTINVALASDFEDGSLYFGDMRTVPVEETECSEYVHRVTYGLIHRGQHKHGAMPVTAGQRHNLIIWMRSSEVRNSLCPMCNETPQLVETEGRGDGFKQTTMNVCSMG